MKTLFREDLLTAAEHHLMDLTAELANGMGDLCRGSSADCNEAALRIHGIQHMILAQAAARAYPQRYRQLGESV